MAFLFGRNKQKSAMDLCRSTRDLLQRLIQETTTPAKVEEELVRNLSQMKSMLQGTSEPQSSPQQVYQLVHTLMSEDVFVPLAKSIYKLPFESRKDAQVIFSSAFRFKPESEPADDQDPPVIRHIFHERPEILISLVNGYEKRESGLICGATIREALKNQSVAALILYNEPSRKGIDTSVPASGGGIFWRFFDWIDKGVFEIAVDAWTTFKEVLTKHKKLVAHFLSLNSQLFISRYNTSLLQSSSYVTKRQSLGLLSSLLLERPNYTFMTRYVASAQNLKLIMTLLRDDSRMIGYEAFHSFKVFVANPNKSFEVQRILINNREKLLRFLPNFLSDRGEDDPQLMDERAYLIKIIEGLPSSPVQTHQQSSATAQVQNQDGLQQQQHQQRTGRSNNAVAV